MDNNLVNYRGEKYQLKSLLKKDKNVFIFIRHFNCFVCADFLEALAKNSD